MLCLQLRVCIWQEEEVRQSRQRRQQLESYRRELALLQDTPPAVLTRVSE